MYNYIFLSARTMEEKVYVIVIFEWRQMPISYCGLDLFNSTLGLPALAVLSIDVLLPHIYKTILSNVLEVIVHNFGVNTFELSVVSYIYH